MKGVFTATFSPGGKRLATISWDKVARFWDVPRPAAPENLALWAELMTGHTSDDFGASSALSAAEWHTRWTQIQSQHPAWIAGVLRESEQWQASIKSWLRMALSGNACPAVAAKASTS